VVVEAAMSHGQWTEVEARGVLSALAKSGMPLERFARERGITPQRIYWWKKKLEAKDEGKSNALALLPVSVPAPAEPRRGEPVTVLLRSGHMIKVARGFDEEAFARVVEILERA
jgi:hypothetical protein